MVATEHDRLVSKYGQDLLDNPPLITQARFEEKLAQWDALDQRFAPALAAFQFRGLPDGGWIRSCASWFRLRQFASRGATATSRMSSARR